MDGRCVKKSVYFGVLGNRRCWLTAHFVLFVGALVFVVTALGGTGCKGNKGKTLTVGAKGKLSSGASGHGSDDIWSDAALGQIDKQPVPEPVALPEQLVGEGEADHYGLLLEYRIRRVPDDTNSTVFEAMDRCRRHGLMLCTHPQWLRACYANADVGKMQSWTATWDNGLVRASGGKFCGDYTKVDAAEREPRRVGLCCERSVAIRGGGKMAPWIGSSARLVRNLEKAVNDKDDEAIRRLFGPRVVRDGEPMAFEALLQREREARKDIAWTMFEACSLGAAFVVTDIVGGKEQKKTGQRLRCTARIKKGDEVIDYIVTFGLLKPTEKADHKIVQLTHRGRRIIPGAR